MNLSKVFGQNVRKQRLRQGILQKHLMQKTRISQTTWTAVERGTGNVSLRLVQQIAKALKTRPESLMSSQYGKVRFDEARDRLGVGSSAWHAAYNAVTELQRALEAVPGAADQTVAQTFETALHTVALALEDEKK